MKKDSGFIEFNAVLLLFFMAAVISGGVLFTAAAMTYSQTGNHYFDNRLKADLLLEEIIAKMQPLRLYPYDNKNNEMLASLCREYGNYALEFTDISSGYHLDFLSDADIADSSIAEYLFTDNTGNAFTAWRNKNGLSVSKAVWREFIKEEAWKGCVSYGWLHKGDIESFAFRSISRSLPVTDPNKLYPLVNDFPRMNVNMVSPEIIKPLIMRKSFKIEKPNEKADALINRLRSGSILHSDVSSTLGIPVNHPLMGYLGAKTAFWMIRFIMPPSLEVEAVVAAIPKKGGAIQEIELYRLVDRRFCND